MGTRCSVAYWFEKVAVVPQDVFLTGDSLLDNL